ncbi:hypothetical protein AGMMS50268_04090 [Spirochaetia bacterium]|nr:hypothetical protein AGMMS50268_04090 [Spirochaetia bacterium]
MTKKKADIKDLMKKYAVEADSVEEFVRRYSTHQAFADRGSDYQSASIAGNEKDVQINGYAMISYHDSITGDTVTWFPPNAMREVRKNAWPSGAAEQPRKTA